MLGREKLARAMPTLARRRAALPGCAALLAYLLTTGFGFAQGTPTSLPPPPAPADRALDSLLRVYDLADVTVTATAATPLTPVTYTNLDAQEIAVRNLAQDAPYLLKWTPSVVVNSDAGTGIGYTGIWIRGSDPTRTNITINGIPYNDAESQGVFWVNLPDFSSSAEDVQIQRGVGTSVNGAGAFGASINFNTLKLHEAPELRLDGTVGSFGTRRGSVNYTSGLLDNGLQIDARYSKIHSDGYIDRARADLDGYYASVAYAPAGAASSLRFVAFGGHEITYQSWNGLTQMERDTFGRTYNSVGTEREGTPYENEVDNYRQNHYQLHFDHEFGGGYRLNVSGHYTRGLGFFEQYKADETPTDYNIVTEAESTDLIRRLWLDNHFYGLVYSLRGRVGSRLDLTLGGAANRYLGDHYGEVIWARFAGNSELGDRYYFNDAVKQEASSYLRANYEFAPDWHVYGDAQLRYVDYTFDGLTRQAGFVERSEDVLFFNPKVGVLRNDIVGPNSQAYLSFAVAQREPNRNDFVNNVIGQVPEPERLYNTELGLRAVSGKLNYGVNFFHMLYRDQLVLTGRINDVGELLRANVARSYRAGVELQGGYRFAEALTGGGDLTLSRNRVESYRDVVDLFEDPIDFNYVGSEEIEIADTPLAFSPDVTGALSLEYRPVVGTQQDLIVALQTKYVGERFVDNSGEEASRLDSYYYADFRVNYTLRPGWNRGPKALRFTFLLRNLTDQLYDSNGWSYRFRLDGVAGSTQGRYPQAGRNFLLGLGVDF